MKKIIIDTESATGTAFRDTLFQVIALLLFIVFMLAIIVNEKNKEEELEVLPGHIAVEIMWNPAFDTDVDLWVQAPGDGPVGYSSPKGLIFNLLRDDLGHVGDTFSMNYENAYTRGLPAGEYIVNIHLYRLGNGELPIVVQYAISLGDNIKGKREKILSGEVELEYFGQELTLVRFSIDDNGQLIKSSVNDIPIEIRVAQKPPTGSPGP